MKCKELTLQRGSLTVRHSPLVNKLIVDHCHSAEVFQTNQNIPFSSEEENWKRCCQLLWTFSSRQNYRTASLALCCAIIFRFQARWTLSNTWILEFSTWMLNRSSQFWLSLRQAVAVTLEFTEKQNQNGLEIQWEEDMLNTWLKI